MCRTCLSLIISATDLTQIAHGGKRLAQRFTGRMMIAERKRGRRFSLPLSVSVLVAVVIAGVIQLFLGAFKLGFIAGFFPTSVIKGLLWAIGLILVLKQT